MVLPAPSTSQVAEVCTHRPWQAHPRVAMVVRQACAGTGRGRR